MSPRQSSAFGTLLKQNRLAAGLSQEALAARSGVSADAISMLERGARQVPHATTIRLLAEALRLSGQEHATLMAAARHRRPRDPAGGAALDANSDPAPDVPLAALFPPARALPRPLVTPLGRERELNALTALLRDLTRRLLVVTGPGGVGKTLLALHAAHAARDAFPDGVSYVPLAAVPPSGPVATAVTRMLAARERDEPALPDATLDGLRDKRRLLVLDNYERVATAAPLLIDLCEDCPGLTILAISRVALHLHGERRFPVPPLSLPAPAPSPEVAELGDYAAIRLFMERAQEAAPGFTLTEANASMVAEVCQRLDGLPLALELAATRLNALPLPDLLARLDRAYSDTSLQLLAGGPCDLPPRQRTMEACLDWSYGLLAPAARAVLCRLAVSADGCTFDAAASVCVGIDAAGEPAARVGDIFGHLTTLVDSHLLVMEQDGNVQRLTMPALVRAFALRQPPLAPRPLRRDLLSPPRPLRRDLLSPPPPPPGEPGEMAPPRPPPYTRRGG